VQHGPLLAGQLQFVQQPGVAERELRLRLVDDVRELARAQQRHGGHRDAARLDHRQPGERQADRVAATQQNAVAGLQAEVFHQHAADAIDAVAHVVVRERDAR
jgi:hypothetical protein